MSHRFLDMLLSNKSGPGLTWTDSRRYPSWAGDWALGPPFLPPAGPPFTPSSLFFRGWSTLLHQTVDDLTPRDPRWIPLVSKFVRDDDCSVIRIEISNLYSPLFGDWQSWKGKEWDQVLHRIVKPDVPCNILADLRQNFPLAQASFVTAIEQAWLSSFSTVPYLSLVRSFRARRDILEKNSAFLNHEKSPRLKTAWAEIKIYFTHTFSHPPSIKRVSCLIRKPTVSRWSGEGWICACFRGRHLSHNSPGVLCHFDLITAKDCLV